ncbi:MAG: pseudaminic acid synthase [Mariniblastus sp.]|nr:pseudaminic acid synthase [Mariniblastus sp.]
MPNEKPKLQTHFRINDHLIGPGQPAYIIAEMSANHHQDFDRAVEIIHLAHRAGADAIKLQTYTPDTLTLDADQPHFKIEQGSVWDGARLYELYQKAHTPWEWQPELKKIANQFGMALFSSPFDTTAVDFLEKMNVPAYKIASFEIIDIPLLKRVAATGKPVIVSTGMATICEIEQAVATLRENGCQQIALLKCTSAYPAPMESMNLNTIPDLAFRFQIPVGLSDHTLETQTSMLAVCLGGSIIEKHLTISRNESGPDSSFSLEPDEFANMVTAVRQAETTMGSVHYGPTETDKNNLVFRRSLFAVEDIKAGDKFTSDNIRSIRPGQGLEPIHIDQVLDSRAAEAISRGTPLTWKHVA